MPERTSGGVCIHYDVCGRGPVVVFAHESTGDLTAWHAQIEHFARRFTCVAFNFRGYPPSDMPSSPESYSQELLVADMLAVLDHLQVESAHLVGLSMGSMTALHFALGHPGRVSSIVLAGTGPGHSHSAVDAFNARVLDLADRLDAEGWDGIMEDYDGGPDRRNLRWKNPAVHRGYCERLRRRDGAVSALILRQVVSRRPVLADLNEELARMDVPVLIATGDQDDDCIPTSLFLRGVLQHSGLAVFPCTGHAVNLEEPGLFNDLLDGFYASIERDKR